MQTIVWPSLQFLQYASDARSHGILIVDACDEQLCNATNSAQSIANVFLFVMYVLCSYDVDLRRLQQGRLTIFVATC